MMRRRNGGRWSGLPLAPAVPAVLAVLALLVAGFGPAARAQDQAASPPAINTTDQITLRMIDVEPWNEVTPELIAAFQAQYPNITVDRQALPGQDYATKVKLSLQADDAPDIVQGNQGWALDGALVAAGQLVPMDEYAAAYGWETRFGAPGVLDQFRFTDDGQTFGTGTLWGIGQRGELIGVYYNKEKLAALGIEPPRTQEEFEAALAAAEAAGETPIMNGNADGQFNWAWYQLANVFVPKDQIRDWVYGRDGASLDTAEAQRAAETAQRWAQSGYYPDGFEGLTAADALARFGTQGEGVFYLGGSWENAALGEAMGNNLGFMTMPTEDGTPLTTGSLSQAFHISAKSEHPDEAAALIDFLSSPEAMQALLANGDIPGNPATDTSSVPADSATGQIIAAWQSVSTGDGVNPYLDWSGATMGEAFLSGMQNLGAGRMSPADYTASVQQTWDQAKAERG